MADRQSLGPLQVLTNSPVEINRVLQEVVDRIDGLKGLRGVVTIHERVIVPNPVNDTDAVNKQSVTTVSSGVSETITGLKTFNRGALAPFAVIEGSAVVTHLNADLVDGEDAADFVHLADDETITGIKTFEHVATRWEDNTGTLIHAFGLQS